LNHLLTYVLAGRMPRLNNARLRECGRDILFYPGMPEFFALSRAFVKEKPLYQEHDISLEHYIVSTGLAEMIRGSCAAPEVDGIWGCEFVENPLQPGFLRQGELALSADAVIAQIGMMIDNTTKTKPTSEITKRPNKNPKTHVKTGRA